VLAAQCSRPQPHMAHSLLRLSLSPFNRSTQHRVKRRKNTLARLLSAHTPICTPRWKHFTARWIATHPPPTPHAHPNPSACCCLPQSSTLPSRKHRQRQIARGKQLLHPCLRVTTEEPCTHPCLPSACLTYTQQVIRSSTTNPPQKAHSSSDGTQEKPKTSPPACRVIINKSGWTHQPTHTRPRGTQTHTDKAPSAVSCCCCCCCLSTTGTGQGRAAEARAWLGAHPPDSMHAATEHGTQQLAQC
jgi:hypothetical protein